MSSALRAALLLGFALTLVLPASAGPAAPAPASAPSPATGPRVLVLGDSISAAYGIALEQGWVALLARRLAGDAAEQAFVNASISGDTSAGGLRRLPDLLARHAPDLLILELGGNDGLRGYPTARLRDNLIAMARLGREAGAEVIIMPMEIPPNYGPRYTEAFRSTFRDAAAATDARLAPFILEDIATRPELMQGDGIHPTAEAQPMIADVLQPFVEPLFAAAAPSPEGGV